MFSQFTLETPIIRGLEKFAFEALTPVQERAIPLALAGDDLMVSAKTGSGKTIAFAVPILQRLLTQEDSRIGTRALILAPTRELAEQIADNILQVASYTQLKVGLIIGGEDFSKQKKLLRKNPEILVATPGRLLDHIDGGNAELSALEILVLDEADRMLDMGFSEEVLLIENHCNKSRQTLLFSATLQHSGLKGVMDRVLNTPKKVTIDSMRSQHENITQQIITADDDKHKLELLAWLMANETYQKALVFCNTKQSTTDLEMELRRRDIRCGALHGDMDQSQRKQAMQRLRDGVFHVLIATDVAARGLDVKGVDLVVNFHMARKGTNYVHRIGRTGRADHQGIAISLIDHMEWNLMISIERFLRVKFEKRKIEGLASSYNGPKKTKASGKSVGKKKPKKSSAGKSAINKQSKAKIRTNKTPRKPIAEGESRMDDAANAAPKRRR